MKMISQRVQAFIDYYTDRTNKETLGNGTKSAEKAGYKPTNAAWQATQLLKDPQIIQILKDKRAEEEKNLTKTKEEAILEARKNYDESTIPQLKKFWWEQWTGLQGWQVQKIESTVDDKRDKDNEQVCEVVREELKRQEKEYLSRIQ